MSKLLKACIALAAFVAFAVVPASAFAENDGVVYSPTNETLVVSHENPAPIVGTNIGSTVMTNGAGETLIACTTAAITGELETNTETSGSPEFTVEATIHRAEFNGCTGLGGVIHANANPATNGLHWCLRSNANMATHEFQVRGGGCTSASRPIRFVLTITSLGLTCTYQRVNAIPGSYTTHPEDAKLSISGVSFTRFESSIFCPSEGRLDMSFTLERETTPGSNTDLVYIKDHDGV